jgi:hypothetical protein
MCRRQIGAVAVALGIAVPLVVLGIVLDIVVVGVGTVPESGLGIVRLQSLNAR